MSLVLSPHGWGEKKKRNVEKLGTVRSNYKITHCLVLNFPGNPWKKTTTQDLPLRCRWHIFVYNTTTALTPSRYRIAQWNPGKTTPSSKPAAASALRGPGSGDAFIGYVRWMCAHVKWMSQTVKDAEPPLAHCGVFLISFFFFYHPEWDHGSCCKSYRGNKRCLVLNFHAASPEQFPYRRAIRVIPQFKKKKKKQAKRRKKKQLTPLWFIVLSSGPLRHRFSLSGLFRC